MSYPSTVNIEYKDEEQYFPIFFYFCNSNKLCIMESNTNELIQKALYSTPFLSVFTINLKLILLQSNLEPIGGGDDPDIDW